MDFSTSDYVKIFAAVLAVFLTWINRHRVSRFLKANLTPCKFNADDGFVVLVADLVDDPGCTQTNHLVEALGKIGGFQVRTTARILSADPVASDRGLEQERLNERAQELLREFNADVLVWGKYYKDTFQLGFVPRQGDATANAINGLTGYEIKPDFTVPSALTEHLRDFLQLTILDHIRPANEDAGTYLVCKLLPVTRKVEKYLNETTNYPEEQQGRVWNALGVALTTIGEQSGDKQLLHDAVIALNKALETTTQISNPQKWAAIQVNLGNSLIRLGECESNTMLLENAVEAYRKALKEYTRDQMPGNWALAQHCLGAALHEIGEREAGTEHLTDAVVAYTAALEERTRKRSPLDWAMTQDNLGSTLRSLGERETDTTSLELSINAYKNALQVRTRERTPLYWAGTQLNLGSTLFRLGERMLSRVRLEEALLAYENALLIYKRERLPLDWANTQLNLGATLQSLGNLSVGTINLEKAVEACNNALEVYTRERAPLRWAMAQTNLGGALLLISHRTGNPDAAKKAVIAFECAREEYQIGAPHYLAIVNENIRVAHSLLTGMHG